MTTSNGPLAGQSGATFPKRFYKDATIVPDSGGFALALDGRAARTPARSPIVLPNAGLAQAVADEWAAVETVIDPRDMPLTRLTNSVIDGVSRTMNEVRTEILRYAGSDLLAYRAPDPAELVETQHRLWNPILLWVRERYGAEIATGTGVMFVAQPEALQAALETALDEAVGTGAAAAFRLGAVHVVTTLTGSTVLALAVALQRMAADEAWAAAHVDEDFQIAQWGPDEEATQRRAHRWGDMATAARMLDLLRH